MNKNFIFIQAFVLLLLGGVIAVEAQQIGQEVSVQRHLQDGEEYELSMSQLLKHGDLLFSAVWTGQEGGGRPLTKGSGGDIADPDSPLVFPRNFNRVSAPDANSCAGCHTQPFGIPGGGGDIVANVFVLGQRFDFATFSDDDVTPTRGTVNEAGEFTTLDDIGNSRATVGMFGSGYIEMLARQMTADLQAIRDGLAPGESADLYTKGVHFGMLARNDDGTYDTSSVEGLPAPATVGDTPSLVIHPFHQAGAVVSVRQFTNNAYNHHHGIQTTERFGEDTDPDGDGYTNEMTVADVTAASFFQAVMAVPGRVIPRNRAIEEAVLLGEQKFEEIGCSSCHVSSLPLDNYGWFYSEPNPYNPAGNLQVGDAPSRTVNLNGKQLPQPRLKARNGVTYVPAYTDLKLHDITSGPDDPNREALNMHFAAGSDEFFAGNGHFLTKKLWGAANEPPYFHHGKYTTLREATLAHAGDAQEVTDAFNALTAHEQNCIIEFMKTLQVLPPGTKSLYVDENYKPRNWPPNN